MRFYQANTAMYHQNDFNGLNSAGNPAYFIPPTYLRDERSQYLPTYNTPSTHIQGETYQYTPAGHTPPTFSRDERHQQNTTWYTPPTYVRDERPQYIPTFHTPPTYVREERHKHIPVYHTPSPYFRDERPQCVPAHHGPALVHRHERYSNIHGPEYARPVPVENSVHAFSTAGRSAVSRHPHHYMAMSNEHVSPIQRFSYGPRYPSQMGPYMSDPMVETRFIPQNIKERETNCELHIFDGSDYLELSGYFIQLEIIAEMYQWTNSEKARMLISKLRGEAQKVVSSLTHHQINEYYLLKSMLLKHFQSKETNTGQILKPEIKVISDETLRCTLKALDKTACEVMPQIFDSNLRSNNQMKFGVKANHPYSRVRSSRKQKKKGLKLPSTQITYSAIKAVQLNIASETVQPTETVQHCKATETVQPCTETEAFQHCVAIEKQQSDIAIVTVQPDIAIETEQTCKAVELVQPDIAIEAVQPCIAVETKQSDIAILTVQPELAIETEQSDIEIVILQPSIAIEIEQPYIAIESEQHDITPETVQSYIATETVKPVKAVDNGITYANEYLCLNILYKETAENPVSFDITCLNEHLHLELLFTGEAVNDQVKVTGLVSRPEIQPMQFLKGQLVTPVRQKMSYARITEQTFNVNKQFSCYSSYLDIYQNVCFQESVVAKECILT